LLLSIEGAYDLHIHSAPCLFPRLAADEEVIRAAIEHKMGGVMLKCHHESSVSRAAKFQEAYDNIKVYGGVVLNTHVGGLNPAAVESTLRLGGKAVWLPTFDSKRHVEVHGASGKYSRTGKVSRFQHDGITILDDNGNLKEEVIQIMEITKEYDAFLGSGHCSPKECFALAKKAKEIDFKKLLINHAHYKVPNLDIPSQQQLIELGAVIEYGYCTISPAWAANTLDNAVQAIKQNGPEHCIIVSDAGQYNNPIAPEAYRIFAQCIFERGISERDMQKLMIDNPKWLLGI
jgi:hypothetical protein